MSEQQLGRFAPFIEAPAGLTSLSHVSFTQW